jgi:hypothetical protein
MISFIGYFIWKHRKQDIFLTYLNTEADIMTKFSEESFFLLSAYLSYWQNIETSFNLQFGTFPDQMCLGGGKIMLTK